MPNAIAFGFAHKASGLKVKLKLKLKVKFKTPTEFHSQPH